MKKLQYSIICLVLILVSQTVGACTSVALSGVRLFGGGTLLGHNRDANPRGYENLLMKKPKNGYAYLALAYGKVPGNLPYIAAGTNQYGLTIVVNDPATDMPKNTNEDVIETEIATTILTKYKNIEAVAKDAKQIFGQGNPGIFVVSDKNSIGIFEGATNAQYAYKVTANGIVWVTNSFLLPSLKDDVGHVNEDITTRDHTVKYWMMHLPLKASFSNVYDLLGQRHYGSFASVNRIFTVAKYIVRNKPNGAPHVLVQFTIPTQKYNEYSLDLTSAFFKQNPVGPISNKRYGILGTDTHQRILKFIKYNDTH